MTLLMLIGVIWAMLSPVGIAVVIGATVSDGQEGFKASALTCLVVLLVLTFVQTISWFVAKGAFL